MATREQIEDAWNKAKKIPGKNPDMYRQDLYGNTLYKACYGTNSDMGWEVDPVTPKAKGGSDAVQDLQALKTSVLRSKKDTIQKRSRNSLNKK